MYVLMSIDIHFVIFFRYNLTKMYHMLTFKLTHLLNKKIDNFTVPGSGSNEDIFRDVSFFEEFMLIQLLFYFHYIGIARS